MWDAGLLGQPRGECAATPWRVDGAMLEGGLINEAIEVLGEGTGHLRGATGARAIHQPLHPLVGKAIDPLAESSIGKGAGVRDGL
jgi:hypothetical protein